MTLRAYSHDYGPKRFRVLYAGPESNLDGPTVAVCLRRKTTTEAEGSALADALPAEVVQRLYVAANERYERFTVAYSAWAATTDSRSSSPEPVPEPLPEWPEVTP